MVVSQCVVRATVTGYCDAKSGSHAAQWVETSEESLTDAVRLQVCCSELCDFACSLELWLFSLYLY